MENFFVCVYSAGHIGTNCFSTNRKRRLYVKILLLNPPNKTMCLRDQYCCFTSKADYCWPPIDLLIQSGILNQEHEVKVIDAIVERITLDSCMRKILEYQPELVVSLTGISSFVSRFSICQKYKEKNSSTNYSFRRFSSQRV